MFCNFRNDCGDNSDESGCPNSCTFEKNMCGWTSPKQLGDIQWLRNKGGTPTQFTGPSTDHTTNSANGNAIILLYLQNISKKIYPVLSQYYVINNVIDLAYICSYIYMYNNVIISYLQAGTCTLKPVMAHLATMPT